MMVKLLDGPVQVTDWLVKVGVTVIVAITVDVPPLKAVNDGRLPFPLAASPMEGSLLDQVNVVVPPVLVVVKLTAADDAVLQTTTLLGWFTWADGLTVMVKLLVGPVQEVPPFTKVGVTTMVAVMGARPPLMAVKGLIIPLPEAGSPIPGISFVQE